MGFRETNGTNCLEVDYIKAQEDSTLSAILVDKTAEVKKILKFAEGIITDDVAVSDWKPGGQKESAQQKLLHIAPEKLYSSPLEQDSELQFVLNTRKKLHSVVEFIQNSIHSFDDEIEREIQLGHAYRALFLLSEIEDYNMDFESIISTLRTSFFLIISGKVQCDIKMLVGFKILVEKLTEKVRIGAANYEDIFDLFAEKNLNIIGM